MNQPVPKVSDKDVERIVIRDFGEAIFPQIMKVLQEYGKQEWNRPGSPRVRLAILKLANGDLIQLQEHTRTAIEDFRDVLAAAEYPKYSKEIGFDKGARKREQAVIDDDWKQYDEWLKRK